MVNKENLRKATEAMRSEKYPQTAGYLRDDVGYCGLGVISDVSGQGQWLQHDLPNMKAYYSFIGEDGSTSAGGLVPGVMAWLGLEGNFYDDDLALLDEDGETATVADLNDRGYDLHRIAALIEKEYDL